MKIHIQTALIAAVVSGTVSVIVANILLDRLELKLPVIPMPVSSKGFVPPLSQEEEKRIEEITKYQKCLFEHRDTAFDRGKCKPPSWFSSVEPE
jgi:hypothetical protein